ncbi:MAG: hypothetical protein Q9M91_05060 [Candidatus Dojkabacteria bacterium]|nr:hypothetical protein [Candidatus Dojkabacteria bacterium]
MKRSNDQIINEDNSDSDSDSNSEEQSNDTDSTEVPSTFKILSDKLVFNSAVENMTGVRTNKTGYQCLDYGIDFQFNGMKFVSYSSHVQYTDEELSSENPVPRVPGIDYSMLVEALPELGYKVNCRTSAGAHSQGTIYYNTETNAYVYIFVSASAVSGLDIVVEISK